MIRSFYYRYIIVGLANGQAGTFSASLTASVDGYQEVVATALYVEGDFLVIVDDYRADIEAMRGYRSNGDGIAMWHNDRTSDA